MAPLEILLALFEILLSFLMGADADRIFAIHFERYEG